MIRFKMAGMTVELHYSLFLLMGMGVFLGSGLLVLCSAVFSFLHEAVHGAVAHFLGYRPEKISFGLFGGVLHMREGFLNPKDELSIHLAGPLFNLVMAAILYWIVRFESEIAEVLRVFPEEFLEILPKTVMENIVWPMLLSNLLLGCFNLLPFYPLDGGKVVNIYLAFFMGYGRAEKISQRISVLFSIFLFFFGIYLVQYNMMNLLMSALAVNLFVAGRQAGSFIFFKVSKNMEDNCGESRNVSGSAGNVRSGGGFNAEPQYKGRNQSLRQGGRNRQKSRIRKNDREIVVYRETQKAMKVIDSYKPWDNHIFTVVNDHGAYRGQLTEEEFLNGIYECGIYADFERLLRFKKHGSAT